MNKLLLKSLALSPVVLLSYTALAQETPVAPAPAAGAAPSASAVDVKAPETPLVKADSTVEKKVVMGGLIQSAFIISDTERKNAPDFRTLISQFNLKVTEGIASAGIDVRFAGNNNLGDKGKDTAGSVAIRRASLSLKVLDSSIGASTITMGRYRPGNVDTWGTDAATGVDGFSGMDGIRLTQSIVSDPLTVNIGFGFANALSVPNSVLEVGGIAPLKGSAGYQYGDNPSSNYTNAMIVNVNADLSLAESGTLKGKVYYGWQKDALISNTVKEDVANPTDRKKDTETKQVATNVSHFEGSLGWWNKAENLTVGAYTQIGIQGKTKDVSFDANMKPTYVNATGNSTQVMLIGGGFNMDSTLIGLTDVLQTGGKITLGGNFGMVTQRTENADTVTKKTEEGNDFINYSGGVGYNVGGLTLEFNMVRGTSKDPVYLSGSGFKDSKSKTVAYITGIYEI